MSGGREKHGVSGGASSCGQLIGASILFNFCYLAFTLLGLVSGISKAMTLGASLAALVIQGYIFYWFARSKEYFQLGVGDMPGPDGR